MKEVDVRRVFKAITGEEINDDDLTILGENPTPEAVSLFLFNYKGEAQTLESFETWIELSNWTDLPRAKEFAD